MNILRIVYDWPDENNTTVGLAPAPYELSISQSKLGNQIYVLCGNFNKANLLKFRFRYELEDGKIVVYNLPRALWKFGPFLTSSVCVLPYYWYLRATKKIDLVHNQGQMGVWFLLYKKLFGWADKIKILGHIHITAKGRANAISKQGGPMDFMTKHFEYPIHMYSDHLTLEVCDQVITLTQVNIDELVELYGADRNKIDMVESGVDTNRFSKDGETVDFGFPKDSIILANGGRLSKRKNIDVIIDALHKLPEEYKLILWGEWEGSFEQEVNKKINDYGLIGRVKYLGMISYFDVDKYFRSTDIFLLPSSYEGLPKVVVEALASGCKTIASGFKLTQPVHDLELIDEINGDHLSKAILATNASPANYPETRKVMEKYYSWDSKAKQLEGIYKKILA